MTRRRGGKVMVWLASACLLVACVGGQTGDPGADNGQSCTARKVPANERVHGVSPADLGRAFAGLHTAPLRWLSDPRDPVAPVADDEITVDVSYTGSDGTTCDDLEVDVTVTITTRDSAVHESGTATLVGRDGSADFATFAFNGERVRVSGVLQRSGGAVDLAGTLSAIATDLPTDFAVFPPPPDNTGTGGSGSQGVP